MGYGRTEHGEVEALGAAARLVAGHAAVEPPVGGRHVGQLQPRLPAVQQQVAVQRQRLAVLQPGQGGRGHAPGLARQRHQGALHHRDGLHRLHAVHTRGRCGEVRGLNRPYFKWFIFTLVLSVKLVINGVNANPF